MVDVALFKNQNQKNKIQQNILCEKHKLKCNSFKLNSDNPSNLFACQNCLIQDNQISSQLLPIFDVSQYDQSTIFLNWPPLNDQNLLEKLLVISQQSNSLISESIIINQFFDEFETQLLQKIKEKKKTILMSSDQNNTKRNEILSTYHKIANFDQLNQIFQDQQMNNSKKSEQIQSIINIKNEQRSENTNLLKQQNIQQQTEQFFKEDTFNYFKKCILSQLDLLDLKNQSKIQDICNLIQTQIKKLQNNIQIQEQQNNKNEIEKDSNLSNIIKLISNQSNYYNQKYLDSVKSELNKLSKQINSLNIEKNVFLPNKSQISINHNGLNNQQIKNIQILVKQMNINNQQYSKINNPTNKAIINSNVQPITSYVLKQITSNQNLSPFTIHQIEILLREFPVFELKQMITQKYDFKIEQSQYNNSQKNGIVKKNNDGSISLEVQNQSTHTLSYIRINQAKTYRIRIKLLFGTSYKHFFIGFIKDKDKDFSLIYDTSKIASFTPEYQYADCGVSRIIQGKKLNNLKYPEEYREIEIRLNVKDKRFEVSDFPKRENINAIDTDKLQLIDTNCIYHLGFELFYIGDQISILEFEEYM